MSAARAQSVPHRRTSDTDEPALVERARGGDEDAFAQLVERYGPAVLSLCYASTLNPADAEELTQDVFTSAWRGLRRFRSEAAFSTWLFALARNACTDRARRAAVRPRLLDGDSDIEQVPGANDDSDRRTARLILEAAALLSLPLREALLLRDVQGLSYEEIAVLQDVPVGTVRSRLSAARAQVVAKISA